MHDVGEAIDIRVEGLETEHVSHRALYTAKSLRSVSDMLKLTICTKSVYYSVSGMLSIIILIQNIPSICKEL